MLFSRPIAAPFLFAAFLTGIAFAQTPIPGDIDHNGIVDSDDAVVFQQNWHQGARDAHAISIDLPTPPMNLVRIPAGSFMMGSPDTESGRNTNEGPVHQVTIGYDFYIGETEVTQRQWSAVMGTNPSPNPKGSDLPVRGVSWGDCQAFIAALNATGEGTFRLPSEAEWEYACRTGYSTRFYYGDAFGCNGCENCETGKGVIFIDYQGNHMWFCGSSGGVPHPVGQLVENNFGLHDMSGNVWEWCEDFYHDSYSGAPTDGSPWLDNQQTNRRVVRGGHYGSTSAECRSASRMEGTVDTDYYYFGFRVVRQP
jgi:formylglycine-generating enzyme required for sulfatase activity